MEIITLIENEIAEGLSGLKKEAGLSLFIRTGGLNILFDTGISGAFADNAAQLGVDLSTVDFAVISHAHYDHTGGLERFFKENDKARAYIKKEAEDGEYYYKVLFLKKNIGIDRQLLEKYPDRFVFVKENMAINGQVSLVTQFRMNYPLPTDSRHILKKAGKKLVPDDFLHEQMMLISEGNHLYCFTGCSHHGIVNMVESVSVDAGKHLYVIGGFHMYNPVTKGIAEKKENVTETARLFAGNEQIDKILTGHCTGKGAYKLLKGVLGDKLTGIHTGSKIKI